MPANPFKDQLKKVQTELAKQQRELETLQDKQHEEGELLRAISRQAGGRQFGVEP
jgi:Skp family chaperone for outer membrane proteins